MIHVTRIHPPCGPWGKGASGAVLASPAVDRAAPNRLLPSENSPELAAHSPSPVCSLPLVVLAWTPECSVGRSSALLVQRFRLGLVTHVTNLRGLRLTEWGHPILVRWSILSCPWLHVQRLVNGCVWRSHLAVVPRRPSLGIWRPFDASGREQRLVPGFHPRLCGAFRLSQPLDALLRSQPLRPCLMPVAPLGFDLQRFSLCGSERRFPATLVPHVVSLLRPAPGSLRLQGFTHPRSPSRCAGFTR
jgi:hypothetical protein